MLIFGAQTTQKDILHEKSWHMTDMYFNTLNSINNLEDCQCCFCGYNDGRFLELHHIDGDHTNYSTDNLDTICSLCHRTLHLGWAMMDNCANLGFLNQESSTPVPVDFSFFNILARIYVLIKYSGREHKQLQQSPFFEWFDKLGYFATKNETSPIFSPLLSLADILLPLTPSELNDWQKEEYSAEQIQAFNDNEAQKVILFQDFLDKQRDNPHGYFALNFNIRVFSPINAQRQGFTLQERLSHYGSNMAHFNDDYLETLMSTLIMKQHNQPQGQ